MYTHRKVLLVFYIPDVVGVDNREREGEVGKKQEPIPVQNPTLGEHSVYTYLTVKIWYQRE